MIDLYKGGCLIERDKAKSRYIVLISIWLVSTFFIYCEVENIGCDYMIYIYIVLCSCYFILSFKNDKKQTMNILTEVLGIEIYAYEIINNNVWCRFGEGGVYRINLYELAHKCKEWAYNQGYLIGLNNRQGVTLIDINTNMVLRYIPLDNLEKVVETELNLCQWIKENKTIRFK